MPLIAQWVRQRPWLAASIAGAAGGIAGIAGVLLRQQAQQVGALGGISTRRRNSEHPLRRRILLTLDKHPGLCYREPQSTLATANGT